MKKKILLLQPSLQPPGGGNGVAAWMIEALKKEHAVSVLTWRLIELQSINRYYGTALSPADFTAHQTYPLLRFFLDRLPVSLSLLKTSLLLRVAKQQQNDYDLLITVNNEADLVRPGIQYVHFPWAYYPRPDVDLRWYHFSILVDAYYSFCMKVAEFSFTRMKQNLTLVNSNWTGGKVRECHQIGSTTLYPPIPGVFPDVPWAEREHGFVCIGRISPEKELDKIIDILAGVRTQGRDVHLHIIGSPDNPSYYARIRRRARENASWVFFNENLSRGELVQLVAQHRYGIHGMAEEYFGMAVAEMIRAGLQPSFL